MRTAPKPPESTPPLIPREVLFGNPTRDNPQVSPDGTRLAYLAPVDGVLNVWVGAIDGGRARPVTADRDRGIRSYFWSFDNQHILYVQDVGGDENWRLYSTALATSETQELTPFENVQVHVIEYDKHFPDQVVLGINKDDPTAHDAYRLDLTTGELALVAKNPGNVVSWVADGDLRVRAAQAATADGGFELLVREEENAEWRTAVQWEPEDGLTSAPVAFARDGTFILLIDSRQWNAGRLIRLDLASGDTTVVAEDPTYDVGSVVVHPDTSDVQMVSFVRARQEWVVLDPSIRADVDIVCRASHGDFTFHDRTKDDDLWVVGFTQDTGPRAFYTLNRTTKTTRFLFYDRPPLAEARLAPMEPISFASRDGLTIRGYLTRPVGRDADANGPMVLKVHGGPWHRDTWGYDAEAQWLANRGYACLQVNFRGSTGFGKEFLNAGNKEWGGRMHDDLVDAVHWAVSGGIADPDRVAIYGGSYGGYAALVGATFTPELFCCAVDIVGVSNLLTFIDSIPPYWSAFLADLHRRVGNPERDEAFLKARSPLFRVDEIRIPILIAQGANDPRVKQAESEQIVEAMREKGIPCEYLLFPDEGHGFAKPANRLRFYAAAEAFLAKHLGGRFQS